MYILTTSKDYRLYIYLLVYTQKKSASSLHYKTRKYGDDLFVLRLKSNITLSVGSTAGFMKTVSSVYNLLMSSVYPSLSTQVAEETIFRKNPVTASTNGI